MKTALFTNMYLYGNDVSGYPRIDRALKFLHYYYAIQDRLGFEQVYITMNGGGGSHIQQLLYRYPEVTLLRHPHLFRGKGHDYLPCWRTTHDWRLAIQDDYEKLICVDDDTFILSNKLITHVKGMKSGWEAMYCPMYDIPETGLHILCQDAFPKYYEYLKVPWRQRNDKKTMIETTLPYDVNKGFSCDRWGERRYRQATGMDAYFQCPVDIEMTVEEE